MSTSLNLGALLLALVLTVVAVAGAGAGVRQPPLPVAVPELGFQRIVSLGLVADAALADLCEPPRVVAVSAWCTGPVARQWSAKPRLSGLDDLEAIIALHPDLVLVSTATADGSGGTEGERIARLRAAGVRVETLGPMRGLATYTEDLARIGTLLGRGDEARLMGQRLHERLARLRAAHVGMRPKAIYVGAFSGTLFGGTVGTTYHEVLEAAGCEDIAATAYAGWPQYSVEQLLTLNPEIIVTKRGMADDLRRLTGLAALTHTRYLEITGELLEDPGPRLLEAAEELQAALAQGAAGAGQAGVGQAGRGTATSR
jgi:iron complex transport system substrate-binding protein